VARAAVEELAIGVLVWQRATVFQVRLTRQRCIENIGAASRVRDRQRLRGLTVIVEDDVMTTGTTLSECARASRQAGAKRVLAATVARALQGAAATCH